MSSRLLPTTLLVLSGLILSGCNSNEIAEMNHGDELYEYYCMDCHRRSGVGPLLENIPAQQFKHRHHEIMLIMLHRYDKYHPTLDLRDQISPAKADKIAEYIMQSVYARLPATEGEKRSE